jgi:tRNA (guanine-N7-)-methyltransferase
MKPAPIKPAPIKDLAPWFLTLDDLPDRPDTGGRSETLDWARFFPTAQPVELDIGCGRGLFLVNSALAHPETNYCGIEIDYREGRRTARRLKKRSMDNARVLGGDAIRALQQLVPQNSVAAVHVYFPDPWWKRKHRRRRIFTDTFLDLVANVLINEGELHSWSDVGEYFQDIRSLVDHHDSFHSLELPELNSPQHDMDYLTSYERKGRRKGSEIHRGRWRFLAD